MKRLLALWAFVDRILTFIRLFNVAPSIQTADKEKKDMGIGKDILKAGLNIGKKVAEQYTPDVVDDLMDKGADKLNKTLDKDKDEKNDKDKD